MTRFVFFAMAPQRLDSVGPLFENNGPCCLPQQLAERG
jgi:hypothetical protein